MVTTARGGPPKVALRGVSKTYESTTGTVAAVESVEATLAAGEFVAVVGPSGGGKTTLLRLLAGLERPSAGEIRVDGELVSGPGPGRGIVFQEATLFPWRTVAGNVRFGLEQMDVDPRTADRRVAHLLSMVGLADRADSAPGELSGGMKKRVEIARALAPDPEILLLDEPFGNLDARTRDRLQRDLLDLWKRTGKTVVFVTHATGEAVKLADRVLVLDGEPGEIVDRVRIDLPRPRSPDQPGFQERKERIVATIRDGPATDSPTGGSARSETRTVVPDGLHRN